MAGIEGVVVVVRERRWDSAVTHSRRSEVGDLGRGGAAVDFGEGDFSVGHTGAAGNRVPFPGKAARPANRRAPRPADRTVGNAIHHSNPHRHAGMTMADLPLYHASQLGEPLQTKELREPPKSGSVG